MTLDMNELERLRSQLAVVDDLLARCPALEYIPTRYEKIGKALQAAARSDALEAALAASQAREEALRHRLRVYEDEPWDKNDRPLPEDAEIDAAHPLRTKRHDLYSEAMRLVGARRSKYGLVNLVNWLLTRGTLPGDTGLGEMRDLETGKPYEETANG